MLQRELFDAMPVWLALLYMGTANTILFTLFRFNKTLLASGQTAYRSTFETIFASVFYIPASIIGTMLNLYSLYVTGLWYFLIFPIVAMAMIPAGLVIGLTPFSHILMPLLWTLIIFMYLTLFGVVELRLLAEWNVWIVSFFV